MPVLTKTRPPKKFLKFGYLPENTSLLDGEDSGLGCRNFDYSELAKVDDMLNRDKELSR
jgi:hypothetical protein